ncbi:uncharacterized protein LOC135094331 isoform X2 [Scylla paramamosain]|uniref:uncharacterized protein LOC135094331 isoform X2 n=1 Tax=Scylla paramamosain TaxID=85552 RepID=UPI003082EEFA
MIALRYLRHPATQINLIWPQAHCTHTVLPFLKNYLTSVCFLTVNAFGYIGSYCVVRRWNLSRPSLRNAGRISGDDCRLPSTRRCDGARPAGTHQ